VILYRNLGRGFFEDVTHQTGASSGTFNQVTWGAGIVDFDDDGHRDIYIACGHLHDNVEMWDDTTTYEARNLLMQNNGKNRFIDISARAGDGMAVKRSSRGAAFDDLNNDGLVDVVVLNSRREPTILRNISSNTNHWLQVELHGTKTNRDGIGARVTVTSGDLNQIDELHSGRGYQSDYGKRLYFGLGQRTRVDEIQIKWIGGGVDVVRDVGVNRLIKIVESSNAAPANATGKP
jgi:enediyne biosynthesis protein E4